MCSIELHSASIIIDHVDSLDIDGSVSAKL